jgi:tetratricopeptide (TPR) repeat protein
MGLTRYKQGKLEEAEKLLIKGASRMDAQAGEGAGFTPVRREIGESLIEIAIANEEPLMAANYIDEMVAVSAPEQAAKLLVHKGTIYVDHRMYDEALEAYGQAMGADSTQVDAYRLSAEIFYRDEQGKYNAQAAMTLGRMARANPTAENYVEAGDAWLKANQAANALTAFEAAVELDPQSAPAQLGLARSAYVTGERGRAAEIYQSVGDRSGFTADDYDKMGRALQEQKKYPEAREAYNQAFERDSTNTDALFYAGYTHFATREWAEAIPYFERRVAIDSTSVAAFVNLGLACWQTENVERGVEVLGTAVELQPENAKNRLWYAQILAAAGRFGESVSQYQMVLEEDQENADAWRSLGFCLLNQERYGEAVNALNKSDRLEPGNAQTLLWLAQAYGLMAELDKAEATFRRVLKINPNSKEAQQGIEMIQQSKKGKRRKASSS